MSSTWILGGDPSAFRRAVGRPGLGLSDPHQGVVEGTLQAAAGAAASGGVVPAA